MHRESTNDRVIDLSSYRQNRQAGNANVSHQVLEDAEAAIEEIAKHLLQAIRIVTARYRHHH